MHYIFFCHLIPECVNSPTDSHGTLMKKCIIHCTLGQQISVLYVLIHFEQLICQQPSVRKILFLSVYVQLLMEMSFPMLMYIKSILMKSSCNCFYFLSCCSFIPDPMQKTLSDSIRKTALPMCTSHGQCLWGHPCSKPIFSFA